MPSTGQGLLIHPQRRMSEECKEPVTLLNLALDETLARHRPSYVADRWIIEAMREREINVLESSWSDGSNINSHSSIIPGRK